MPVANFTVGKDVSLVIKTSSGVLSIPGLTDFKADPITSTLQSRPLGKPPIHGYVPNGWQLSFKMDRQGPALDDFWADFEKTYYAGGNQVAGTIYETIREPDGSVSQYRFNDVVVKLDNAGDFSGETKVMQSMSGMASTRDKVA